MKVGIIGIGLIGGSIALDLKAAYADAIIFGIDSSSLHLDNA